MNIFSSFFQYIKDKCSSKQGSRDIMNYRIEKLIARSNVSKTHGFELIMEMR